jgi:hypothetical protein
LHWVLIGRCLAVILHLFVQAISFYGRDRLVNTL